MSGGRVTRSGASLLWNGHPYRFCGLNVWRAAVTSWNQPPATGYDVGDGTTLADTLAAINTPAMNTNVFRCWFFQEFALRSSSVTPVPAGTAWDYSALDKVLQVADAAGMKVVVGLIAQWSWFGSALNGAGYLDTAWWSGNYATQVLPYHLVPYRTWVSQVVSRYAGDDRILLWELVNEGDVSGGNGGACPGTAGSIASAFCADVGGLIKSLDAGALVSPGMTGQICGFQGSDWNTIAGLSQIDLMSFHDYSVAGNTFSPYGWAGGCWAGGNGLDDDAARCHTVGKPLYVGEAGLHLNSSPLNLGSTGLNRAVRASWLRNKMDIAFNKYQNIAGYIPWHFDIRNYNDDYAYSLSDPGLMVLKEYLHG